MTTTEYPSPSSRMIQASPSLSRPLTVFLGLALISTGYARKKEAPAKPTPAQPAPAPAAPKARVVKDSLIAEVEDRPGPATGPLNLAQLIDLTLFNHPKSLEARRKLEVARAQRLAATDWKDPEFRFSYRTQTDLEVGDPYFEDSTSNTNIRGIEDTQSSEFGLYDYAGTNKFDSTHTRFGETRYRRTEREVIPGATTDKIIERRYEERNSKSTGTKGSRQTFPNGGLNIKNDRTGETKHLQQVSENTTYVHHRDVTDPQDQLGLLLRFSLPNPFEMKARVVEAEAEIKAADYNGKALENEIVMDVRALYEDLAYYEGLKTGLERLAKQQQNWTDLARTTALDKLASAAGKNAETHQAIFAATIKAESLRSQLAQLAGVSDPTRISVPREFRRRVIDLSQLNEAYLVQMASVYRSDLHFLMAKNDSARAAYRRERAALIPVGTFLDFGIGHQNDPRGRDSTDFQIRLGVTLPLWSWLMNDADKVPAASAQGYSREIGRLNDNIEAQVKTALRLLRLTDQAISAAEKNFAALEILMKNEAVGGAGLSKNPQEVLLEADEALVKIRVERLKLYKMYDEAVLSLERALGTRLEKVLSPGSGK